MSFRYRVLSSIFLLLLPAMSFAGNTLKGKVTDTKGLSLSGAIVEITDLKTGAAADTNGQYIITNLPRGRYLVEVHLLSYATLIKSVTIDGDTHQDFVLNENVLEKNEVVVTGASLASEERKSLTPIQSISLRQMHENISSNVIDAIATLPGVSALTTGPAISKPVIRGLGYNRIITLNDGVRQEGQQWGDEHGIEIDDYNVTRIEVLKGPASLAYGSDALAGVINIISNPNLPAGKIEGNITANYQANPGLTALHADIGGNNNGIGWKAFVTQKNAHDYHNRYDGYVYDTRFQNTDYGASIGINKSWGSSRLSYTSFNMRTGIPEGNRDSATGAFLKDITDHDTATQTLVTGGDNLSYKMNTPYQQILHNKLVWDNDIYLGNGGRIGVTAGYQRNSRKEFSDVLAPDVPSLYLLLQTVTYDVKYFMRDIKGWQIHTGINGMSQWNENKAMEYLVPDYSLFDGGVYGMAKKDIRKWTIAGGIRYDLRRLQAKELADSLPGNPNYEVFNAFSTWFSNLAGSVGAGYNFNSHTILKLNLASGYRSPNIAELSANGVHEGTVRYEIGNTGLRPENCLQTDLGLSWSSEHVLVNVSVFDNYIRNFIYLQKDVDAAGNPVRPAYNNPEQYEAFVYTQGDANLYGGELYIDLHPHPLDWLHLENTFSYVRGNLMQPVEGTTNLPNMPPARWLIGLRAQTRVIGKYLKNGYAKVGLDVNFTQNNVFTAYNTETATPGYTLLDAGLGADVCDKKGHALFSFTLAAQNITDVAYQNALSRLRYTDVNQRTGRLGIYNMGRNFSIIISVPLNIR